MSNYIHNETKAFDDLGWTFKFSIQLLQKIRYKKIHGNSFIFNFVEKKQTFQQVFLKAIFTDIKWKYYTFNIYTFNS